MNDHTRNGDQSHHHERQSDPLLAEILSAIRLQDSKFDSINKSINRMQYDIATTREAVERLEARADKQDQELIRHMSVEEDVIRGIKSSVDSLAKGFPKNPKTGERDPAYHAGWHEDDIDKSKEKREFRKKIRDYIVFAILGAVITGTGALFLSGVKVEVKRLATEEVKK